MRITKYAIPLAGLAMLASPANAQQTIHASWDIWGGTDAVLDPIPADFAATGITATISEINTVIRDVEDDNGNDDGTYGSTLAGASTSIGRLRIEKGSSGTGDFAINITNSTGAPLELDELLFDFEVKSNTHDSYSIVFENITQGTTTGVLGSATGLAAAWQNIDIDASSIILADGENGRFVISLSGAPATSTSSGIVDNVAITSFFVGNTTPPDPDPMTLETVPAAVTESRITMTADTATDPEGGAVEYRFTNTTAGTDSGWQSSPTFTDTGLDPGTLYDYTVEARDEFNNTTAPSTPAASASTLSGVGSGAEPNQLILDLANFDPETSSGSIALNWNAVTDRIYSVHWSYDLSDFHLLEDAMISPRNQSTDIVNQVNRRFYKLTDFPRFVHQGIAIEDGPQDNIFPCIIKASDHIQDPMGTWYLYHAPHAHRGIYLAYSDSLDGPWTNYGEVLDGPSSPFVKWIEDENEYFMWAHGAENGNSSTEWYTSIDGINWTLQGTAVHRNQVGTGSCSYAKVFEHDLPSVTNKYIMLYSGYVDRDGDKWRSVWLAHSNDAKNWTQLTTPIIEPEEPYSQIHDANIFMWKGTLFVAYQPRQYGASGGDIKLVKMNANFDPVGTGGERHTLFAASPSLSDPPDYGRLRAPFFLTEGNTLYMFYESGSTGAGGRWIRWATANISGEIE